MPFTPSETASPKPPSRARRVLALVRRRASWLFLGAGLITLVSYVTVTQGLPRFDRMLQENTLNAFRPEASRDIVIVAIDDKSMEAIGRWPWRRALHAEVLRQIAPGQPRCIGLDLLLTDEDKAHPGDDALLARRMKESGCVVLPMALQAPGRESSFQSEVLPIPLLAGAATALGHAHLSIDDDGVARGVYLQEGFPGRDWPHFALAIQQAAAGKPAPQPSASNGPMTSPPAGLWKRRDHELLYFASHASSFQTVSYIDVLRGQVPPTLFKDKYVLIGATAGALGDVFASSAPTQFGLVPGVEIFATVLQGLISDRHIVPASTWENLVFNLVPLVIVLVGLLRLGPLGVFVLILTVLAARTGLQMAQPLLGIRFAPAAGLGGLLLVYPLWSLMRLTAAYRFLRRGTRELNTVLDGMSMPNNAQLDGDFLDREIDATAAAVQRVRDLHRFVRDGVDHLPDATLVLNRLGVVFTANRSAARHWQSEAWALVGKDAHTLLADIRSRNTGEPMIHPGALSSDNPQPIAGEAEDASGRILLLRCVPFFDAGNTYAGWMIALVDITKMRRAQSQRDEALRFISHDIREPSASILTVVELARAQPSMLPRDLLLQRIERHARTGLELADGFVNLARAEAQPFKAELVDLVELTTLAIDNAWAEARTRDVLVRLDTTLEEAPCIGDRSLLPRALTNVLGNALKYSPPGSELLCTITERRAHWAIGIRDQGPGIPAELQPQLFQPFHRLHRESHPDVHGVGLGLLLVRTAMQRHGGSVEIDSAENAGCTVTLVLPKPTPSTLGNISKAAYE
ncbi:CHASE2 domain-containing protein [Variovorax sp. J22R133]|uniref:CHASE2 domain-containing protein n=1 Tax=Variovorax brevis TaxID=3053503 RepID=UPI0025776C5A|nr:CHASE2 domain-containing protein [Variovorax sp. J22R133]MDM0115490.1 CHASE2 domain-containing protein [Variovorax sp. J22R133]